MDKTEKLSIKTLVGITIADIDIFLLQDESQTKDLDKVYTTEEIREQLHKSCNKMLKTMNQFGFDIDEPLIPSSVAL